MSYRVLVTAIADVISRDFVIRGEDMGDVLAAKDHLIRQLNHREPGLTPTDAAALEFMAWNLPTLRNITMRVTSWDAMEERADWIKVYADREYVVDLATGEVTSPQWSQDMETYRPQIEALKAK